MNEFIKYYAKGIIAAIGSAVTFLLLVIPENTTLWIVLGAISAVVTTATTVTVPNGLKPANGGKGLEGR